MRMDSRWNFICGFLSLMSIITVTLAQDAGEAPEDPLPKLILRPSGKILLKAVGDSAFVQCSPEDMDDPTVLTDLKWIAPDGSEIGTEQTAGVYVERSGGENAISLYFKNLRAEDGGTYRCEAMSGNIKVSEEFELQHYRGITWKDAPVEQNFVQGTDAKIKCVVEANPPATVSWRRDDKPIQNGGRFIKESDGLLITSIVPDDEGEYACRAMVVERGSLEEKEIRVEVYISPEWVQEPVDQQVVEMQGASIPCEASGKPNPTYIWTDPDNADVSSLEGFSVDAAGTLNIDSVSRDMGGEYRCVAENAADRIEKTVTITVITKPKIEELLNVTVDVEKEGVLSCKVSGEPLPDVTFRKLSNIDEFQLGVQPSDDRVVVEPVDTDDGMRIGQLRISDLNRTDDGLYECIARSKGGEVVRNGHITVQFPPSFSSIPQDEVWSWEGIPVNLTCIAESIPNATISWELGGDAINSADQNLKKLGEGPTSVLRVTPVTVDYYKKYKCKATNLLGEVVHEITLREAHRPDPILQATYDEDERTATTVTFTFIGPRTNGGLEIDAYAVQYKVGGETWDRAIEKLWTIGSRYVVENLQPQTTYVFRFAARNDVGLGEWGAEETITMPKRSAPESPLILGSRSGDIIQSVYHDRYQMQWNIPEANGVPIDEYQIVFYRVEKTDKGWQEVGTRADPILLKQPNAKEYELKGLRPETHYRLELRAHNSIGYSTPDEVVVLTAKGNPQGDMSQQPQAMDAGTTIGIIVAVLFIILVIVDLTCYFVNKAGLTYLICTKCCGQKTASQLEKEACVEAGDKESEKTPLTDGQPEPQPQKGDPEDFPLNGGQPVEVKDGSTNGARVAKDSAV